MRLPNAHLARVEREKICDYLLSSTHPDGWSKAFFFLRHGFHLDRWELLAEASRKHGASYSISGVVESEYGIRYTVDGPIETPDGRRPVLRSVWILDQGDERPRLITAYPIEGRGK